MGWKCPKCGAQVRYQDYERALAGAPFICHGCGLPLVVDKKTDQPIAASTCPPAPKKISGQ